MKDEFNKDGVNRQAAPNLSSFLSFDELMHEYEQAHRVKQQEASVNPQEAFLQTQETTAQQTTPFVQAQELFGQETVTAAPQQTDAIEYGEAPEQKDESNVPDEPPAKRERIHFKHEARAYIPVNPEEEYVTVVYEEDLPQQTESEVEPQPELTIEQQSDETDEPQQPVRSSKFHDYFRRRKKNANVVTEVEQPPEQPVESELPPEKPVEVELPPVEPVEVESPPEKPVEVESPPEKPVEVDLSPEKPLEVESSPEKPTEAELPPVEPVEVESPPEEPVEVELPPEKPVEVESPPEEPAEVDLPPEKPTEPKLPLEEPVEVESPPEEPLEAVPPPEKTKKTKSSRKKKKKAEHAKIAPTRVIIPYEEPADETLSYGNEKAVEQLKLQAKNNRYTHSIPLAQRESRREMTVPISLKGLVTVVIFLALIEAVFAANIILPDKQYSQTEKRSLTQLPEFSFAAIKSGSYMERFESYISDQFLFRDDIVSLKATAERILGKKEQNNIYLGKDGWLFEKQSEYSAKNVGKLTSAINVFCKRNSGIKSAVLIAPNSGYIMSDMLPAFVEPDSQAEQLKNVYKLINDEVDKINVLKTFADSREKYQLYYRTDHHWTTRAARIAFLKLADTWKLDTKAIKYEYHTVSTDFSGTLADSSGIYEIADSIEICMPVNSSGTYVVKNADLQTKSTTLFDVSKLDMQNKYEVFCGGNNSMLTISTTNRNAKKLLIFKDSYANCMIPMFTPYFQEIVVIDPRYFTQDLSDILANESFTHMLFLYNMNTFLEDNSLVDVISGK